MTDNLSEVGRIPDRRQWLVLVAVGVAQDSGVASATLNTGQQIGGSIGTSLLNTIFATAVARYARSHPASSPGLSLVHGYTTGCWVAAAVFAAGAVVCGALFRSGPLRVTGPAAAAPAPVPEAATANAA